MLFFLMMKMNHRRMLGEGTPELIQKVMELEDKVNKEIPKIGKYL